MSTMNEDRLQRIEEAWIKFLKNDMAHLKADVARIDERTKGHGKLIGLMLLAMITMGPAILVAVLVT